MRIIAFLPLIFPILAGCASIKPATASVDSTRIIIRDSVIFRDSVIMIRLPQESAEARLPDNDTSVLETSIARSAAWIDNGVLFHALQNKSEPLLPVNVKLPTRLHSEKGYAVRIQTNTVVVPRNLTAWQSFSMVFGRIVLAGILIFLSVHFIRKRLKI